MGKHGRYPLSNCVQTGGLPPCQNKLLTCCKRVSRNLIATVVDQESNGSIEEHDNRQEEPSDIGVPAAAAYCQVGSSDKEGIMMMSLTILICQI